MTKKFVAVVLSMLSLVSCAGLTHPGKTYRFHNQREIFHFDRNLPMGEMPNENFGKEAFYLSILSPVMNEFYYALMPSFLLEKEHQEVTFYSVTMLYNGREYPLSKGVETFRLKRWSKFVLIEYKLPLDSYYYDVAYMDEEQRKRINRGDDNYLSIVPIVDFTKIFKEKIDSSFPVSITVVYQIDDGEIITHTSEYNVVVQKNKYHSYFDGY